MKICILSNSHGAALKTALNAMPSGALEAEVSVFAAPGRHLSKLLPNSGGQHLVVDPRYPLADNVRNFFKATSGKSDTIEIGAYDGFILHGLYLIPPRLDRRHSGALAQAAVRDMLALSSAPGLARALVAATSAPVLISPEPLLADQEGLDIPARPSNAPSDPLPYDTIMDMVEAQFGVPGVHWLRQPPHTMGERLSTLRHYSTESTRLAKEDIAHKDGDVRHMNADYGRLVLEAAAARFSDLMQPA
jgi:hypothetical protein